MGAAQQKLSFVMTGGLYGMGILQNISKINCL